MVEAERICWVTMAYNKVVLRATAIGFSLTPCAPAGNKLPILQRVLGAVTKVYTNEWSVALRC